jgi:glycosyltransferase involved in cell wall biosynthesis
MPLISVIIPAHNSEKTIKATIASILNQTFTNFELLIINDGSTDTTLEAVKQIEDSRLQIFSYSNSGVAVSRNRGISLSQGDFISFIDADDLWTPDKLELQLKALQANSPAEVAYSWTDWIDENDRWLRPGIHTTFNGDVLQHLLLTDFIGSGSNPLINASAFQKVGGFDDSLTNAHDWDMWLRLAGCYEFVAVPSVQILYRICTNSMSTNVWGMEAASLKVIEKNYECAPTSIQYRKKQTLANRYQYLTFKALEGNPCQKKGLASAHFLLLSLKYQAAWTHNNKTIMIVLFKILLSTLIPSRLAFLFIKILKKTKESSLNIQV